MPSITFSRFRTRFSIGSLVPGRVGLATLPSGGTGAPRNLGPVPEAQNRTIPDTMQWTLLNNPSSLSYPDPAYIEKDQLLQFYPMQQILWYISVSSPRRPQEWWYLANSSWVYDDDDGPQHIRWPYDDDNEYIVFTLHGDYKDRIKSNLVNKKSCSILKSVLWMYSGRYHHKMSHWDKVLSDSCYY